MVIYGSVSLSNFFFFIQHNYHYFFFAFAFFGVVSVCHHFGCVVLWKRTIFKFYNSKLNFFAIFLKLMRKYWIKFSNLVSNNHTSTHRLTSFSIPVCLWTNHSICFSCDQLLHYLFLPRLDLHYWKILSHLCLLKVKNASTYLQFKTF